RVGTAAQEAGEGRLLERGDTEVAGVARRARQDEPHGRSADESRPPRCVPRGRGGAIGGPGPRLRRAIRPKDLHCTLRFLLGRARGWRGVDLWDVGRIVIKRWYVSVPVLVAALAMAVFMSGRIDPEYSTEASILLVALGEGDVEVAPVVPDDPDSTLPALGSA